jgi:succinoglycan biosynthesis protein ExoM
VSTSAIDETVVVAVPTRDRLDRLSALLPRLVEELAHAGVDGHVLVVDNSPSASARDLAGRHGARYVHEPRPGLASVRNRVLDEAAAATWLALIDDDELPSPGWLTELLRVQRLLDVDVVAGPALLVPPTDAPRALVASGLFDVWRPRHPTGAYAGPVHTNNVLVRGALLERSAVRFDPQFDRSGGEDTDFFWTLREHGAGVGWAENAVVTEEVHADRLSVLGVLRRQLVTAATYVRIERRHGRASVVLRQVARAAARLGRGLAGLVVAVLTLSRGRAVRACYDLAYAIGTLLGLARVRLRAY